MHDRSFIAILLKVASFGGTGNIIMTCCQISSAVGNARAYHTKACLNIGSAGMRFSKRKYDRLT